MSISDTTILAALGIVFLGAYSNEKTSSEPVENSMSSVVEPFGYEVVQPIGRSNSE